MSDVIDDKYRQLKRWLYEEEDRIRRGDRVARVYLRRKDYDEVLQILEVHSTEDGYVVICR
jgi:hypothetical protein